MKLIYQKFLIKAGVAQLVERSPSKSKVTGSSPVTRFLSDFYTYRKCYLSKPYIQITNKKH